VGVAGYDGGDSFVVMGAPLMEAVVNLIAEAGVGGRPGWVFYAEALEFCPEVMDEEVIDSHPVRVWHILIMIKEGMVSMITN
jgi:hypothetical protein